MAGMQISLSHISVSFNILTPLSYTGHPTSVSGKKSPPQAPRPSITVSDVKMVSDEDEPLVTCQQDTSDRLCPNVHQSYRRHSSPSALGEAAEFEFPSSPEGDVDSPTGRPPIRHGGRRNQSSPFLSRGSVRTRAQSSSSEFASHNESRSFLETWSCLAPSPEEDSPDTKFLLQSPPKRRSRNRTCPSRTEHAQDGFPSPCLPLKAPPNTPSAGGSTPGSSAEQDSTVARAKRKMMNAIGLATGDTALQGEEILPRPPRSPQRSKRCSTGSASSSGLPPLDWLENSSNEDVSQSHEASLYNRRPSSPCRLYKIVKDAEERITNMTSSRPPNSPKSSTLRQKSPSTSPLPSPRCPRSPASPSANAGVVVTSSRPSRRRSSISMAAAAFAAATAGASSPGTIPGNPPVSKFRFGK